MGRRKHPRASILLAVAPLLQREVHLDELLDAILHEVALALSADRGTIYLVDPDTRELFSKAAKLPEIPQIRLKMGQGIAGTVAATGETLNLPRVAEDHRFFQEIDRLTGYKTQSCLATPLQDRSGSVIGVIQVLNATRGAFTQDEADEIERLAVEVALAIENTSLYAEVRPRERGAKEPLPARYRYNHIVGESTAMHQVYDLLGKASATDATVLLRGESGTGKELIARAIHFNGARRDRPFVKLDCTTIPATLMENELFGHERGAYTGASGQAKGKCELAHGGTLFIDEIGELPVTLQAKLLRFIQDREFERVGGSRTKTSNARVITATHRNLEEMIGRALFREDLYYRIRVVQIRLPSLRERGPEDIERLARHFLDTYRRKYHKGALSLSPEALSRLTSHSWPGNIRELQHCIESAVVICDATQIGPDHLSLPPGPDPFRPPESWRPARLSDVERRHIIATIKAAKGNRTKAAKWLGIGRNTILRKLKEYGEA